MRRSARVGKMMKKYFAKTLKFASCLSLMDE